MKLKWVVRLQQTEKCRDKGKQPLCLIQGCLLFLDSRLPLHLGSLDSPLKIWNNYVLLPACWSWSLTVLALWHGMWHVPVTDPNISWQLTDVSPYRTVRSLKAKAMLSPSLSHGHQHHHGYWCLHYCPHQHHYCHHLMLSQLPLCWGCSLRNLQPRVSTSSRLIYLDMS